MLESARLHPASLSPASKLFAYSSRRERPRQRLSATAVKRPARTAKRERIRLPPLRSRPNLAFVSRARLTAHIIPYPCRCYPIHRSSCKTGKTPGFHSNFPAIPLSGSASSQLRGRHLGKTCQASFPKIVSATPRPKGPAARKHDAKSDLSKAPLQAPFELPRRHYSTANLLMLMCYTTSYSVSAKVYQLRLHIST